MGNRRKKFRPLLLIAIGAVIVTEIVALSPSNLEESKSGPAAVEPEALMLDSEPSLIPGFPQKKIAEYGVEDFRFVSVQNGIKQWRIEAKRAFLYNPERLVHSRKMKAFLYDPEGKITTITGDESKYFLNHRDLEVFGNVKTLFPDGFELDSDYLRYKPEQHKIEIPKKYRVHGIGQENAGKSLQFFSKGLDYWMSESLILLNEAVRVTLSRIDSKEPTTGGIPDSTVIESDQCLINRKLNLAKFTMNPRRPMETRFVHISQPRLLSRSRKVDLSYGDFSAILQYMTAYEDVLIKDTSNPKSLRYATGGRADFDNRRDVIVMTQFPQVYQDQDTVTGDLITIHRDTDIVNVEHSNAFSQGTK
ncbi:MAG: LPS export ABC transporter periplasmic protein LptC [Bdellovibrionia bacterium]